MCINYSVVSDFSFLHIISYIFSHPVRYKRHKGGKGLEENKKNWRTENQALTCDNWRRYSNHLNLCRHFPHWVPSLLPSFFLIPFHLLFVDGDSKMCEKLIFVTPLLLLLYPILMFPFHFKFLLCSLFLFFSFLSLNIFCIQSRQNKRNGFCRWQHLHLSISKGFHTSRGGKRKVNFSIRHHKKTTILILRQKIFN
jgi:hypothetical protein